jgi:hypothetical protein
MHLFEHCSLFPVVFGLVTVSWYQLVSRKGDFILQVSLLLLTVLPLAGCFGLVKALRCESLGLLQNHFCDHSVAGWPFQ